MSSLFAFLFLAFLGLTVWGTIAPRHFTKYVKTKSLRRKHVVLSFSALTALFFVLTGVTAPPQKSVDNNLTSAHQQTQVKADSVTTKQVTETQPVHFTSTTQNDATLPKGQTKTVQTGKDGVETFVYDVTYTNGVETGRRLVSQAVTAQPVQEIIASGTYVAPPPPVAASGNTATNCANGTYVNSAGNTVCRPEASSTAPAGATAQCRDGTYSFSQSRSGTCSHHGGVAAWL